MNRVYLVQKDDAAGCDGNGAHFVPVVAYTHEAEAIQHNERLGVFRGEVRRLPLHGELVRIAVGAYLAFLVRKDDAAGCDGNGAHFVAEAVYSDAKAANEANDALGAFRGEVLAIIVWEC